MGFADLYLEKQKNFENKIKEAVSPHLKFIVVIPCYHEFKLIDTLQSIKQCDRIQSSIEVIIVINSSEDTPRDILDQNRKTFEESSQWIAEQENQNLCFFVLNESNLPKKFAGAGLARKIGMDQAILRFNTTDQKNGVIISVDADAKLKSNYFVELEKHFKTYPKTNAITTYFEHPLTGDEFNEDIYSAIITYELYLRYYKQALHFTGFPYSFYTIGSCFAVSAKAYIKQGGMNRKQAGEDFYFLHKVFPLQNCYEINSTCVYPSSRISDRVPFGTGPMIKSIIESENTEFLTYCFDSFLVLKSFFKEVDKLFRIEKKDLNSLLTNMHESMQCFLLQNDFEISLNEINANSSNLKTFVKRFFNWFDAFRVLKYLNFAHENYFNKQALLQEVEQLTDKILLKKPKAKNHKSYLEIFRDLERNF